MEEWKIHPEWPYEISTIGRVQRLQTFSKFRVKPLKPFWAGTNPYWRVRIYSYDSKFSKQIAIHILVLEAHVGLRPPEYLGLHKDDNRENNDLSNLYWGSRLDNAQDSLRNNQQVRGFDHPNLYIKREEVINIRKLYLEHMKDRNKAVNGFITSLVEKYPHLTYKCVYKAATGAYDGMV